MSHADPWSWPEDGLPGAVLARFEEQSQLDFEIAFFDHILCRNRDYVDVLRCQGELLSCKGLHELALEVDRRLVQLVPTDPVVHYNLACSLALAGARRQAIAALQKALELGYDDLEHLTQDDDLDSLRDDQAFLSLLREFSERLRQESPAR
jgi:tetratricopeptide (TPR) repeat protein